MACGMSKLEAIFVGLRLVDLESKKLPNCHEYTRHYPLQVIVANSYRLENLIFSQSVLAALLAVTAFFNATKW